VRGKSEVRLLAAAAAAILAAAILPACQPKVQVVAPKEPITINLNVKIEHEIRVRVDKDLDDLFAEEEGLF
jgi:cobalamin biosynthesis protein CbiD